MADPVTPEQIARLRVHADYLGRQARNSLADDLRSMLNEVERLRALHDRWCDFQDRLIPVLRSLGAEDKVTDRLGGGRPGCQHAAENEWLWAFRPRGWRQRQQGHRTEPEPGSTLGVWALVVLLAALWPPNWWRWLRYRRDTRRARWRAVAPSASDAHDRLWADPKGPT